MEFVASKLPFLFLFFMAVCRGEEGIDCPRVVKFSDFMEGRILVGHVLKRIEIKSPDVCKVNCFLAADCVSFNIGPLQDGEYWCELSNSDHIAHPQDLVNGVGTIYQSFLNHCASNPCPLNGRCQTGFTDKGYRCVCPVGFTGQNCSKVTLFVYTFPKIISTQKEQQVTFTCNAFGSPRPIITWRRSHGTLSASRTLTTEGNLSIMNVTIGDSGFYVCNATSAEQKNSSSVELKVFYSLAHVVSPELSVTLYVGQALKLSCPTSSSGTELWLYNGSISVPQDAYLETPGILLIPSLRKDHVGNYSCLLGDSLRWNVSLHVKFPETCSIVKQSICDASGDYVIDPDGELGEDPFTVYCNMTDKVGVGVTVVSHDSESRILVKGIEAQGGYRREIHYIGASLSQIKGLTDVAANCQQFIRYECYGSRLLGHNRNNRYGWWVSRDGADMTYWGGATVGCACGMTNSCDKSSKLCNCDKNDQVWREDSGLLTNKLHLPVSQLRFGDTGHRFEEGYHTLGKLECYGMS